ncbi:MAG: DNA polymerase III subunit beta [Rhodobacteraceae bacterium]|nr:DNA polymerase III subunit beta [Paracoccaceae bacterium]
MIVSVQQEKLMNGLNVATRAIYGRPHLPILENVLLEADNSRLKLTATNLDMRITAWIPAEVLEAGSITLPGRTFSELVSKLPKGRIDMKLDASTHIMGIRCGIQNANIHGIDADDFPPIQHGDVDFYIRAETLGGMIDETTFASATDDYRPVLECVYVKISGSALTMVASDGRQLAKRTGDMARDFDGEKVILVPAKAMDVVARVCGDDEVGVGFLDDGRFVTFTAPNVMITVSLFDGKYPDFSAIIPSSFLTKYTVYKDDLLAVCRRAEIFARDNANSCTMVVQPPGKFGGPAEVVIVGKSAERGDTEGVVAVDFEDEPMEITFNIKYLIGALNVIKEERVIFQGNGPDNAAVIKPEGRENFVYVFMPMSL